ncbi:LOW QUALITY PROTEIN: cytochrome P450 93A3-like protein [Cinnamomum micranthum f. kanehirae]|uniref:Cytochrome P450 93A3-like protein n=1 Tax=Cinnamomum micranthum f. kanehirae TaxID=337451 RepID=A0A3S3NMB8_9MAGN|nr:LOW QUALITY PROTEIN: cytochrome P450 93A3-like protein [Cinnamomum micranthum f. kanehirae]
MEDIQYYAILFLVWLVSTLVVRAILILPHQTFHKLSIRYGPLILLRLGSVPTVIVSSVEAVKEILKTTRPPSPPAPQLRPSVYSPMTPPALHLRPVRALLEVHEEAVHLLSGRTLDSMLPIRRLELRRFLQLLAERSEAGKTADMGAELMAMTNSVISMMAMRKRCSTTDGDEVHECLSELGELVGRFNLGDFNALCKKLDLQGLEKRFKDLHWRLDRLIGGIIQEHLEERRLGERWVLVVILQKDIIDISA